MLEMFISFFKYRDKTELECHRQELATVSGVESAFEVVVDQAADAIAGSDGTFATIVVGFGERSRSVLGISR